VGCIRCRITLAAAAAAVAAAAAAAAAAELFRRHAATDAQCRLEQPLLDALSRAKLPNCGVVECTLEFGEDVPIGACIRSARMLEVDCEDASEVKRE